MKTPASGRGAETEIEGVWGDGQDHNRTCAPRQPTTLRERVILRLASFCAALGIWCRALSRAVDRIVARREQ